MVYNVVKAIKKGTASGLGKISQGVIDRAILKAAFDATRHAKRLCPVETGRMRASIRFRVERGRFVLGAYTDYASYVEFGTPMMERAHGKHDPQNPVTSWEALEKRSGKGQMMPFIRPALHMFRDVYLPRRLRMELGK